MWQRLPRTHITFMTVHRELGCVYVFSNPPGRPMNTRRTLLAVGADDHSQSAVLCLGMW